MINKKKRRDAGRIRLGQRDIVGLQWLSEQGAMRLDQLARLFELLDSRQVSQDAARKTVNRWLDQGWATSRLLLQGTPSFIWLTRTGARITGSSLPCTEPALATLQHNADVVDIRLDITRLDPHATWRSERQIRSVIPPRNKDKSSPHLPDAEVRLSDGRLIAIERERVAKTIERTRKIQMGLLTRRNDYDQNPNLPSTSAQPRYDIVCYYTTPAAYSVVTQARDLLPHELSSRIQIVRAA